MNRAPTGAGSTNSFSSGIWSAVDEVPPDTADYIECLVANQYATFVTQDLPAEATGVSAVMIGSWGVKSGITLTNWQAAVLPSGGSSGQENFSASKTLPDSYGWVQHIFDQDPSGPSTWTVNQANYGEFGFKVVA